MAHEIESMFSVKITPWHGLGTVVKDAPKFEDINTIAGLDWNVSLHNVYFQDGSQVPDAQAIKRDSDNAFYGVTGSRWKPLQNSEALDVVRPFIDSGEATIETAGSLRGGARVWWMLKLNKADSEIGNGDYVRKYILLSNAHDGLMAARFGFTPIRVVCANTLGMAIDSNESKLVRVFHSKKIKENLEFLRETVNAANNSFEATADQYRELTRIQVSHADVKKYVKRVFYNGSQAQTDRETLYLENLNNTIVKLFESGHGSELASARGTAWGLYNAATEYLSYEKGRTADTRLDSLWFGQNKSLNQHAFQEALNIKATVAA